MDKTAQVKKKDQIVRQVITVQIVHFHCPNCNEEEEHVKLCNSCKVPMRVVQVTEKYGDEAEKYLESLKKLPNVVVKTDMGGGISGIDNVTVGNALATSEELEKLDEIENGYSVKPKDESEMLAEFMNSGEGIFSDDDDDDTAPRAKANKQDLDDILAGLDESDDNSIDPQSDFSDEEFDSFKDL